MFQALDNIFDALIERLADQPRFQETELPLPVLHPCHERLMDAELLGKLDLRQSCLHPHLMQQVSKGTAI